MRNELDALVRQMVDGGILYREALTQFKKVFIGVALRDKAENKSKTARVLGMHRNTFIRTITDLGIKVERCPPQKAASGTALHQKRGLK
jgi:DNA-binding NtrC family response regulator